MPIAALVIVLLAGAAVTSWLIDREALRQTVVSQIRAATGVDLVVNGGTEISLFPGSYITLRQVALKGNHVGGEPLVVADLTANLRLLPLLAQHFEIADLTLSQPVISVVREGDNDTNWSPIIEALAKIMKPGFHSQVSFSEIRIKDGILAYRDPMQQIDEQVSGIDISLAWPSISRSFAATGQFDWHGERIDGSLSIADFIAALSGERSGLKARVTGTPLKLAFDGTVANRTSLMLEGTLTADSPSLRDTLRWAGQMPPGTGGFGRFALKARANLVGESVALTNVNVELDGNTAEGVLAYNNTGRRTLQGTLAAETLDLTPYVQTIRLLATGARDWNRQSFDLRGLSAVDLDMRLSAAKAVIGPSKLGRTALGANLRDGTLALSIGEAQIYGGIIKGTLGIARADANADIKAQFQFNDIDLEAGASELFGIRKLAGRGNVAVTLSASGTSAFALAQSLDGTATLTGHDGQITGLNVEQLLRRLERRPLSGAGNFRSGVTPFDRLNLSVQFNDGIATVEDGQLDGPTAKLTLTGSASVPSREYDLKGVASLISAASTEPVFQLPFVVQGPWDDPLIFPDSDLLIRRSPASAPLLDSLKDRKTRDAVRSVIDRFTGARKSAPDAGSQPQAAAPPAAETPSSNNGQETVPAETPAANAGGERPETAPANAKADENSGSPAQQ